MNTTTPSRTQLVEHHESRIRDLDDEAARCRNAAWAFEALADRVKTLPTGPGYWTQAVAHLSEVSLTRATAFTDRQLQAETEAARLRQEGVPS